MGGLVSPHPVPSSRGLPTTSSSQLTAAPLGIHLQDTAKKKCNEISKISAAVRHYFEGASFEEAMFILNALARYPEY